MATWQQIETILDRILPLEKSERTKYIEKHVDDPTLKKEILALLEAELNAPQYLDQGVEAFFTGKKIIHEIAKNFSPEEFDIDRYRIEKELGRGGMSVVYLAERTDGEFDQKVAVKIIQPFGLDREDRFQRLRAERQILANLQHPNIARVFDGGITLEGWPYMVMEFVEGIPFTTYCRERDLGLEKQLELFMKICDAVIYAHRNLVVHRDLKPGNILVTDSGQVKLLDFGIAKLLTEDEPSLVTRTGRPLMTPEYGAPEQFRGETITTSVDVYSLGVILYELLAGVRPYDLSDKSIAEMERLVCDEIPLIPSEKVSYSSKSSSALKGDLDVICMKALRKEPAGRYSSVQELKKDLVRHLEGLPIQARPASFTYRTKKFIKRNKASFTTAIILLISAIAFGLYHFYRVTEQRNIAQLEAEKATRIKDFTTNLFFANSGYYKDNVGEGITLRQVLETAAQNVDNELSDDPEIYAEMKYLVGFGLKGVGEYEQAKITLEKSLETSNEIHGKNNALSASILTQLGQLESLQGNYEAAFNWLNSSQTIYRELYGPLSTEVALNHIDIGRVYAVQVDYEKAEEEFQKGLGILEDINKDDDLSYYLAFSELINVQIKNGDLEEAEKNQLFVLENLKNILGGDHASIADSYSRLAEIYTSASNFKEAENYGLKDLQLRKKLFGADHPLIINANDQLGYVYQKMGEYKKSEMYHEEAIRIFKENSLTDSLSYSMYLNNLAITKNQLGQTDSAIDLYNDVIRIKRKILPDESPSVTISLYNLAFVYYTTGAFKEAKDLFTEVVERDKQSLGNDHPEIAVDLVKLAMAERELMDFSIAEEHFSEAEIIFDDRFPEKHYRKGEFYFEYGKLKMVQGDTFTATDLLKKSLNIFMENYGENHEKVLAVNHLIDEISLASNVKN